MAGNAPRMGSRKDLFGGNVRVASDAVLGSRSAALPFVAVGKANRSDLCRGRVMERGEALPIEPFSSLHAERGVVLLPGCDGVVGIDPRRTENRFSEFGQRYVFALVGEDLLRPWRSRIRDDVPVDVEADNLLGEQACRPLNWPCWRAQHSRDLAPTVTLDRPRRSQVSAVLPANALAMPSYNQPAARSKLISDPKR